MSDSLSDLSAYAGRWVALFGEQVTGVGDNADAAAKMARHSRPKERFVICFVDDPSAELLPLSPLLERIRPLLNHQSQPVYLVGGAVRDALLGRVSHDLDFVVPENAIKLTFQIADALGVPAYVLDKERDTGRVMLPDAQTSLDFARFRGGDLASDLRDRDLTINAMALPATATTAAGLIDLHNGQADLAAGLIRHIHVRSFLDDPIRTLRAVRLAHSLGFTLASETETAVRAAAPTLKTISTERIRDELLRLLQTAVPHHAITDLANLGLLAEILPDIAALTTIEQSAPHHEPVFAHTLSVLRWLALIEETIEPQSTRRTQRKERKNFASSALFAVKKELEPFTKQINQHWQNEVDGGLNGRTLLRLSALFHDVGKAETQTTETDGVTGSSRIRFLGHEQVGAKLSGRILRRLCLSNEAIAHVKKIVAGHMRPLHLANSGHKLSRRAVYRYFRKTAVSGVDIAILSLADHLATHNGTGTEARWQALLTIVGELCHHYFEKYEETVAPPPLVNGRTLMQELSLPPGSEVGRLLRLIQEAQAAGELKTAEAAIQFAQQSHK
ncbi:CCA tRNA nucleotidyltransferase [hydrothermal vent metagenome]|uniref:CCA tRNA nucleotidyltransferase n=1 Tax=hydrothermal vent metagenome TaxID=652676 RepID=A0A3B0UZB2_9ZZZZ